MTPKEPGLAALEAIAIDIKGEFETPEDAEWSNCPLKWIRSKPSATVGKIGRTLVKALCDSAFLQAKPVSYSLVIKGKTLQVKNFNGVVRWRLQISAASQRKLYGGLLFGDNAP